MLQNNPYSQSYNQSWRNHPNLSYKNPPPNSWQQQSNASSKQHHYSQPSYDSRPASVTGSSQTVDSEAVKEHKEMKEQLNKLGTEVGSLTEMMKRSQEIFQAMMASQSSQNATTRLPSQPEANPKQCGAIIASNAVTTRSGKTTVDRANTQPVYVAPPRRSESVLEPAAISVQEKAKEKVTLQETDKEVEKEPERMEEPSQVRIPFPMRLDKSKEERQFTKFLEAMKDVQITIPILDAVTHIPLYAKFFKDVITKKRSLENLEVVTLTKDCSVLSCHLSWMIQEASVGLVLLVTENSWHSVI